MKGIMVSKKVDTLEGAPYWFSNYITWNCFEAKLYCFNDTPDLKRYRPPHTGPIVSLYYCSR